MDNRITINNILKLSELDSLNTSLIFNTDISELSVIWNIGNEMYVHIDNVCYEISKNSIFFLNTSHSIENIKVSSAKMLRFSKTLLCSYSKDNEMDLNNLFGLFEKEVKIISMTAEQLIYLENSWNFLHNEISLQDRLQNDIVSLLLKRIINLCAQAAGLTGNKKELFEIVSSFNYLVENHFCEHHDVAFYASKLNKSPKMLSTIFSTAIGCPPKDFIHERIMVDARNQILYTDKSIKEISYDLGYDDLQTFSRFFKSKEGIAPLHYREKVKMSVARQI
ncbi:MULTISPECIES: AraC family transcriptional regulator [Chryseobacterium]|uniref:AraC-type DNA-binding protein n=1 Tax=Chryseobacterium wanjuense TaxID=356305 RepID=A0A1I0R036_9FLAO|nr:MULTISPECIES: helix-turn-helix domain-containing protein [Chryseobacterium]KYH08248.1 hypothetical protein A1704_06220 [Chryseobacterium cucumeris]SEW33385.1 AraC-type DNA-binding protein [Chryseobacterium wanjuense]